MPTIRATKKTLEICDERFGKSHHGNNKNNAFRHALWNVLICKNALEITKNKQKSVFWTQKVGDLYEKVTQNNAIDKAMDLHNNAVGRVIFFNTITFSEEEIITLLLAEMERAIKIDGIKNSSSRKTILIYID